MVASFKLLVSRVSFCRFLHPRSVHIVGVTRIEKEWGVRGRETNRGRDWVANMEELWHSWKGGRERERNSCIESDYEREAVAKSGSPLCLTVTRWQRFAVHLLSLASVHLLLLTPCCLTIDPPRVVCIYVTLCICLGWEGDSGERYRMGGCKPPVIPHSLPFLFAALSSGSLKLEVLNQAVGPRGKTCLSLWNFIIFNYLDHDGSLSPSLPVPPSHLVTQT